MTKKDYELVASVVRSSTAFPTFADKAAFILDMGATLARDNPKFDMNKWATACLPVAVIDAHATERTIIDTRI